MWARHPQGTTLIKRPLIGGLNGYMTTELRSRFPVKYCLKITIPVSRQLYKYQICVCVFFYSRVSLYCYGSFHICLSLKLSIISWISQSLTHCPLFPLARRAAISWIWMSYNCFCLFIYSFIEVSPITFQSICAYAYALCSFIPVWENACVIITKHWIKLKPESFQAFSVACLRLPQTRKIYFSLTQR